MTPSSSAMTPVYASHVHWSQLISALKQRTREIDLHTLNAVIMISLSTKAKTEYRMLPHKQTKQQLCYHGGICASCAKRFWASHSSDLPQDSASSQRTRQINFQTLNAVIMISLSTPKKTEHPMFPHKQSKLPLCYHGGLCVSCAQVSPHIRF